MSLSAIGMCRLQDWDMLELEHGAIVDRNACVFCHLGLYRNGTFVIEQVSLLSLCWMLAPGVHFAFGLCFCAEPHDCWEACLSIQANAWLLY